MSRFAKLMSRLLWFCLSLIWTCTAVAYTGEDMAQCKRFASIKEWKGTYTLKGTDSGSGAYSQYDGQYTFDWNFSSSFSAQLTIPNPMFSDIPFAREATCSVLTGELAGLYAFASQATATASAHEYQTWPADNGTGQQASDTEDWVPNNSTPVFNDPSNIVASVTFSFPKNTIEISSPEVGELESTVTNVDTAGAACPVCPGQLQLGRSYTYDNIIATIPAANAASWAIRGERTFNDTSRWASIPTAARGAQSGKWTETWELLPTYADGTTEKPLPKVEDPCLSSGSIIGCENQSLGEVIDVAGTSYRLHYQSDRTPGNASASAVAIAYAADLGGWTLDVHHRYDPASNTLFLGTGAFRSSASLGTVTASATGGFLIAAEDGQKVYEFDANGVHTRTLNALTGGTLLSFTHDATSGGLTAVTDGNGNITSFTRNANGKLTAITGPYGQVSKVTLNAQGYLTSLKDPAGKLTRAKYTPKGLLTAFTNARGMTSTLTYDANGLLLQDKNPAGGKQTLSRSSDGNTVTRTTTAGLTTTYQTITQSDGSIDRTVTEPTGLASVSHKTAQLAETITTSDGLQIAMTPADDPRFGKSASIPQTETTTTPGGLVSSIAATRVATLAGTDPLGLTGQTETLSLNGNTFTSSFDAASNTFTDTSPAGRISIRSIDSLGRTTSEQVAGLDPVSYLYDTHGRLASIISGSGGDMRTMTYSYDTNGFLQTLTDPLGRTQSYVRDKLGRPLQQTLPDGSLLKYAYDANGNLTKLTNPANKVYKFSYGKTDLMTAVTAPAAKGAKTKEAYFYNPDGQLTGMTRLDGVKLAYTYDTGGRLSTLASPDGNWTYGYDAARGYLNSITEPGGINLGFTRDGQLLTALTWSGGPFAVQQAVEFDYNNDFQVESVSVNNADPVAYSYDSDGLLTTAGALTLQRSSQNALRTGSILGSVQDGFSYNAFGEVTHYQADFTSTALMAVDYAYDPLGRITQRTETLPEGAVTYSYTYDQLGQLASVTDGTHTATYTYDSNGNRLSGPGATGTYDAQDRLLSYGDINYGYNKNGEVNSRTDGSGTTQLEYNLLGNLVAAVLPNGTSIDYLVDGAGMRIGKKVNGALQQAFLYQSSLRPVAELDGTGSIVSRFVYATHVNVPDYMIKGGVTYRIITDQLGSPRLVVDATTGAIVQRLDYDEFGNVLQDTNPGFQPFGFAGGLYDADTKLVHFGAREYDPKTGRWLARDPIGFEAEDTNLYGYVQGDPVNRTDPAGLEDGAGNAVGKQIGKDVAKKLIKPETKIKKPSPRGEYEKVVKKNKKDAEDSSKSLFDPLINLYNAVCGAVAGDTGTEEPPKPPKRAPDLKPIDWKQNQSSNEDNY
jgi:RHS repeat-associated protein